MESEEQELCAPKPIRNSSRSYKSNKIPSFLEIDIPSLKKNRSNMSTPSSMASSISTCHESECSSLGYEGKVDKNSFSEELIKLLNNDGEFETIKRSSLIYHENIPRPINPFFSNFEDKEK